MVILINENSKKYNNAKIIWIIDVFPLTKINLEKSISELVNLNQDVDLIVYIGNLDKIPNNLYKVPDNFLKRQSIFSGKILDKSLVQEEVFRMSIWNIFKGRSQNEGSELMEELMREGKKERTK